MNEEITININGEEYIARKKNSCNNNYVIVRTYSASVFAGELVKHEDTMVVLRNAIRLWKWAGAFTLSEIAMRGVCKPDECKFALPVNEVTLTQAIEIIPCTEDAEMNIKQVKPYEV